MSEAEIAQGFGFNLTAVRAPAEPISVHRIQGSTPNTDGEARGGESGNKPSWSSATVLPRGGSQQLCGKPRRMGVRQGKRGAAGEHGCSLAASKSLSGGVESRHAPDRDGGGDKASSKPSQSGSSAPPAQKLEPDELHRDPFFSSKHKLKEIWRGRRPSYWLDMCGRRHK